MSPQPIGAGAYGIDPAQINAGRRIDVAKFQKDITRALNADEAVALSESFGQPAAKSKPVTEAGSNLGRHIDVQA